MKSSVELRGTRGTGPGAPGGGLTVRLGTGVGAEEKPRCRSPCWLFFCPAQSRGGGAAVNVHTPAT